MRLLSLFTLDYEINGDGTGSVDDLMVDPTWDLMELLEAHGARLTILAEVAEIIQFRDHFERTGQDTFSYKRIAEQLRTAVQRGHDVQLHIHPSFMTAEYRDGSWQQNWDEYSFGGLSAARATEVVAQCKSYLEELLRPIRPDYQCTAFRAGNWAIMPSANPIQALIKNGIAVDSSVFKHGVRSGVVEFDYRSAESDLLPWRTDSIDIRRAAPGGQLWEYPIYAEALPLWQFVSPPRLYNSYRRWRDGHRFVGQGEPRPSATASSSTAKRSKLQKLTDRHPWRADFNQCSGGQMRAALDRAYARYRHVGHDLPFVLIGHSKLHNRFGHRALRNYLRHVERNADRYGFATFADCQPEEMFGPQAASVTLTERSRQTNGSLKELPA